MVSARHGPVFAIILVVPATRDGLGPFYPDVIAVSPLEPWDAASDGWRLQHGYLRVAWRGDRIRPAREAEFSPGWRRTDLEVTHPLHTLRRRIDTPLPLFAAGLY